MQNRTEAVKTLLKAMCKHASKAFWVSVGKHKYSCIIWRDNNRIQHELAIKRVPKFMRKPTFVISAGYGLPVVKNIAYKIAPKDELWTEVKDAFDIIANNFEDQRKITTEQEEVALINSIQYGFEENE